LGAPRCRVVRHRLWEVCGEPVGNDRPLSRRPPPCNHVCVGIHIRSWDSSNPQQIERLVRDATVAAERAGGDVKTVMGHLTAHLAGGGDYEHLRKVARILAAANSSAAEAVGAAREARETAQSGDAERAVALAAGAQGHAIDARAGANEAMEIMTVADYA
jgi:hypothetical protein